MKVLFLHGWQSVPGGIKPTYLKDHGHEVINPRLPDEDFSGAVRIAQAEFDKHQPAVVVGSSRGGAVAMNINSGDVRLVKSFGFKGHCPHFLRHSSAVVLLAHRVPATSLHWTADEGKTWNGPVKIDTVGGAYPSMVELPDGLVYCVYYEEGMGSSIRAVRLRVDTKGVTVVDK